MYTIVKKDNWVNGGIDMKKILAITVLLISLLASTCFAADWYWLLSSDTFSEYVDRNSGQWNGGQLTCTEKSILDNGNYLIIDITYDYSDFPRIKQRENCVWGYNADGTCEGSFTNSKWTLIAPESVGEEIAVRVYHLFKSMRK